MEMEYVVYDSMKSLFFAGWDANDGEIVSLWHQDLFGAHFFENEVQARQAANKLFEILDENELDNHEYIVRPANEAADKLSKMLNELDVEHSKTLMQYISNNIRSQTVHERLIEYLLLGLATRYGDQVDELGNDNNISNRVYIHAEVSGCTSGGKSFSMEFIAGESEYGNKQKSKTLLNLFQRYVDRKLEDNRTELLQITSQ